MHNHRKLGRLEQNMEMLNSHAKIWNLVTISRIKKHLNEDNLKQSLEIIQYRYPQLNSRIIHSPKGLYFQSDETPKIALRVVKKLDNDQCQEVVNEEFNQEINSNRGLHSQPSISRHTMEELVNNVMSCIFELCTLNLDISFLSWMQS